MLRMFQFKFMFQLIDDVFPIILDFLKSWLYEFDFLLETTLSWTNNISAT